MLQEGTPVKPSFVAIALLLLVPGAAQAADRCGRATTKAGAGSLELSLWQPDRGTPSEHATLSIPSRDGGFMMVLSYHLAGGRIGAPYWVEVYAYAPWARQVRVGDMLSISAGRAQWRGATRMTGLRSRSGLPGAAAAFEVVGDQAPPDPALLRAFAAGGKVRLARATKEGTRIKADLALPRPQALGKAYQTARAQAAAALRSCPPPSISPISAP
jgi:hypothetical protein